LKYCTKFCKQWRNKGASGGIQFWTQALGAYSIYTLCNHLKSCLKQIYIPTYA